MAVTERRIRARQAIQQLAAERDLPTDLDIISERWNTVARLGQSDVIVKAATLASLSRINPGHWFEQEVRVSAELAHVGAPVQSPWNGARPYRIVDELPITLWQRIEGVTAGSSEEELVDSLAAIHRLGREVDLNQPWFATITAEVPGTLAMVRDRGVLSSADTHVLGDYLARLLDVISAADLPDGLVHGDAQRKNSLHTPNGTIWIDLEETCIGPYVWDIACLTMNPRFDSGRVLDRYAEVSGSNRVSIRRLNVLKHSREIEGLVWMLAIQDEREPEFRLEAAAQLHRVLSAATAD